MKHKLIFIPLIVIGGVVATLGTVIGGLNLGKFAIYHEYYNMESEVAKCPGLDDNFIPQGMSVDEENDKIIVAGYMSDKSASRIYITDSHNNVKTITLKQNGEPFTGHCGGVANENGTLYLANGDGENSGIYDIPMSTIYDEKTNEIELDKENHFHKVDGSASFVFTQDGYIYIGEFNNGKAYKTNHPYETKTEGTHYAVVGKYLIDSDGLKPLLYYSIRDQVQGFAMNKAGEIVLSTSYGLASSHYYVYHTDAIYDSGKTLNDAPVYIVEDHYRDVIAPAMSEDLDYNEKDGKIYVTTEAGSNKYIFGKFFNAKNIYALDFWPSSNK